MPAPDLVVDLVKRFEENKDAYLSGRYNETELRRDFLDPFFEALGWDVRNVNNHSEKYRDVIHEQSVEVEGQAKSADYLFKIGDTPIFFVEAKKPSVDIVNNPGPAFQLKTYAWSKKLPLSLLTDFETLAFYECTSRPLYNAPPSKDRVDLYTYKDYITKWEEVSGKISRNAVTSGAYDRYVQDVKGKHGTTDVDDDFLVEMERWRNELAHNIALRNPSISQRELNFAVQATIDRIIFLRICEDRGIEPEGALKDATDGIDVYGDLLELFRKADRRYNSGLFHFSNEKGRQGYPDTLTPTLKIDDKVFKDILSNLYLPKSPYAFRYFSADILGQVYERFLGKVITLTPGHRAKVDLKPEVRKAGGVYYTPTFIVNYIVNNTVGEILKDKTPETMKSKPIRILDPACGSGSFLIGAYQYLIDWYLDWYLKNEPSKWAKGKSPEIMETLGGWQLTLEKKKQILLDHIFGVDIDYQAVEVTKLSLLLKVVENPGQLSLIEERILPDLGENIKCGNSLIGEDYFENRLLVDKEERYRVNPFDWEQSFPNIFRNGGFSVVVGNPPYIRSIGLEADKKYFNYKYLAAFGAYDIYVLFMEKSIKLIMDGGYVGFITPNKYFVADYGKGIRNKLMKEVCIKSIADFGKCKSVFEDALITTAITIFTKQKQDSEINLLILNDKNIERLSEMEFDHIPIEQIITTDKEIRVYSETGSNLIIKKITQESDPLSIVAQVRTGVMGFDYWAMDKYISDDFSGIRIATNSYVDRYEFLWGKKVRLYKKEFYNPRLNPTCKILSANTLELFNSRKIIVRGVAQRLTAHLDEEGIGILVAVHSVIGQKYSDKYLLGLLNSKLFNWIHVVQFYSARIPEGSLRYPISFLNKLPIKKVDFNNKGEVFLYDRLVAAVDRMIELRKRTIVSPIEQEHLNRETKATDHQIDMMVYELYGLTKEEIKIVEQTH